MNGKLRFTIQYTVDHSKNYSWRILDNHTRRLAVPRTPNKQAAIDTAVLLNQVHEAIYKYQNLGYILKTMGGCALDSHTQKRS
jgi:hypothetical protein